MPAELVIAVMQSDAYALPEIDFPVRQVMLKGDQICLAKARNAAAAAALSETLVFLDVDCIPSPDFVADYAAAMSEEGGVFMGEVGYLPSGATDRGIDFAEFERQAVLHSERAGPPQSALGPCRDYRCFWSLNFALSRTTFERVGGFDERYVGYGGEDTDFGRKLAEAGIPIWWARGAKAYHQYHPHHMPPVHHLDSVMRNSSLFCDKWGEPTMQHWLRAFRLMGLIDRDSAGEWIKLRDPNEADLALTRQQEDQPFASSAVVLAQLEAAAADRAPEMATS
ncbi:galactosyltransferase-related protein [Erythrobacter litoralis]|uniref:galactosyltransferase-related protein n=1 Tax=Erythrobacter litoralis TaxID=39960 RepID=UPI0024356501|nr:galactosyltransferase-related protein [Erythrobacter litoralis]